jgi:hypothetical protein
LNAIVTAAAVAVVKIGGAPSLLVTILTLMAKAKLKTIGVAALAALLVVNLTLYIHNKSQRGVPSADPKPQAEEPTEQVSLVRALGTETKSLAVAAPVDLAVKSALDNLRKIVFSPDRENIWPSPELFDAIHALGPNNARLAVPLLSEGLQDKETNVQTRAVFALSFLAVAAKEGKWSKPFSTEGEWEFIDAEPLRLALFKSLPGLRDKMRASPDGMTQQAAIRAATTIYPQPELLPDIVEAMRPATAQGQRGGIALSGKEAFAQHPGAARTLLEPLLKDPDEELRVAAACSYPARPGPEDLAALEILTQGLGKHFSDIQILDAIKLFGADAKPYIGAMMQRSQDLFRDDGSEYIWELKNKFCSTLAAIDPELRSRMPELNQWFKEQEQLATLKARIINPEVTLSELTAALEYRETRYDALKRLGELGPAAADALPALREALKNAWKFNESPDPSGRTIVSHIIQKIEGK